MSIFNTPASPWTIITPRAHPRILLTPTRIQRLKDRYTGGVDGTNPLWTGIVASWKGTDGIAQLLIYLVNGNNATGMTALTSAYNSAIAETFGVSNLHASHIYTSYATLVLDWGYADLTSPQKAALVTKINADNATCRSTLVAVGQFHDSQNEGSAAFAMGTLAVYGEPGATDYLTDLRNMVQNYTAWNVEQFADGGWQGYGKLMHGHGWHDMAYYTGGGIESQMATNNSWYANWGKWLLMKQYSNGWKYGADASNTHADITGQAKFNGPEKGCVMACFTDLAPTVYNQQCVVQQVTLSPNKWSGGEGLNAVTMPAWVALFCHDPARPASAQSTLPLAMNFQQTGYVDARTSWDKAAGARIVYSAGPNRGAEHDTQHPGHFEAWVGWTPLIWSGYDYAGRASNWENYPAQSLECGGYSMTKSCPQFVPVASASTRPDRDGGATIAKPANAATVYPASALSGGYGAWPSGLITSFTDSSSGAGGSGSLVKIVSDLSAAFPQVAVAKRTVGFVRGNTISKATTVIYDQFVADATIGDIRSNFWFPGKPVKAASATETVVQGQTLAGLLKYTGADNISFTNGSYKVTLQIVTPFTAIDVVGGGHGNAGAPAGPGYEQFFDSYAATGGNTLDYATNTQDNPVTGSFTPTMQFRMQGIWRAGFRTTQSTAGGEMIVVVTLDAAGTTAPSYTKAQALALLSSSPVGNVAMPGLTQYGQKLFLNFEAGKSDPGLPTLYAALFSTVPLDDGSGGVEVSAAGYARQTLSPATWANSANGSPATISNAAPVAWGGANVLSWPTVAGVGLFDAPSSGNLVWADYLGTAAWAPFSAGTIASPAFLFTGSPHGLVNGNTVAVTDKYGGVLPATAGSWAAPLTVANATANSFTAGVNTTSGGAGMFRQIVATTVPNANTVTLPVGAMILTQA